MSLAGALTLGMFASHDLSSWLDRMDGGPLLTPAQHAAASWDHAMDRIGLTRPAETARDLVQRLLDWDWRSRH